MTKIATTAVLSFMLGTVLSLLGYIGAGTLLFGAFGFLLLADIAYDAWQAKRAREADRPEDYCA